MCALGSALQLCVYIQTAASLDTHKWVKVKRKAEEPVLIQLLACSAANELQSKQSEEKNVHTLILMYTYSTKHTHP